MQRTSTSEKRYRPVYVSVFWSVRQSSHGISASAVAPYMTGGAARFKPCLSSRQPPRYHSCAHVESPAWFQGPRKPLGSASFERHSGRHVATPSRSSQSDARILDGDFGVARRMNAAASARYGQGGGSHADIIQALSEEATAKVEIARLEGERSAIRARLNALIARPVGAPLAEPVSLPVRGIANPDLNRFLGLI